MPTPQEIANQIQQYRQAIAETRTALARDEGSLATIDAQLQEYIGDQTSEEWLQEKNTELGRLNTQINRKLEYIRREFPL